MRYINRLFTYLLTYLHVVLVDLTQTMQLPSDCCDLSFLMETNYLEEKENISAKEKFISQQKEQLERERQKLLDFAVELAKQVLTLFKVPNFQLKLET